MEISKKKVGRPKKITKDKAVKLAVSITGDNHRYILGILEANKMEAKGHVSQLLNRIIAEHKVVQRFKDKKIAEAQAIKDEFKVPGD